MFIYEWKSGFSASSGEQVDVKEILFCKNEGKSVKFSFRFLKLSLKFILILKKDNGLDKIESQNELIQKYSNCLNQAENIIPNERKSRTYIFLAATAGMRLLW
jgi:hypothetical protein